MPDFGHIDFPVPAIYNIQAHCSIFLYRRHSVSPPRQIQLNADTVRRTTVFSAPSSALPELVRRTLPLRQATAKNRTQNLMDGLSSPGKLHPDPHSFLDSARYSRRRYHDSCCRRILFSSVVHFRNQDMENGKRAHRKKKTDQRSAAAGPATVFYVQTEKK